MRSLFKHDGRADTAYFWFRWCLWIVVATVAWLVLLGLL